MYWPFFRSKQEELMALKEIGPNLTSIVVPIIKPHSVTPRAEKQLANVLRTGMRIALIIDSDEGEPTPTIDEIANMDSRLNNEFPNQIFPTLEVHGNTNLNAISTFNTSFDERWKVYVHRNHIFAPVNFLSRNVVHVFLDGGVSQNFINSFQHTPKVLLRDGFQKQQVNGNYPTNSYFDDLLFTYNGGGFDGFGDFAAIGDVPFSTGGGAANHVALHLTVPNGQQALNCKHFVSDDNLVNLDTRTQYLNALSYLVNGINGGAAPFNTAGVGDYKKSDALAHFPGLGKPKRWSTKHHLELVHSQLVGAGTAPWI